MKLKDIDRDFRYIKLPTNITIDSFSPLFRFRYGKCFDDIKNFSNLTIGAVLKCAHLTKPSEVFETVNTDLQLKHITENDKCLIFFLANKQLTQITTALNDIDKIHPVPNKYRGIWNNIASEYNISPDVMFIDRLAERNHISWEEAQLLKWPKVYLQQKIDAENAAFEHEMNQAIEKQNQFKR